MKRLPHKMHGRRFRAMAAAASLFMASLGLCDSVQLHPQFDIDASGDSVRVRISLENRGTDLADDLAIFLDFPFGATVTNRCPVLDPGCSCSWEDEVPLPADTPKGSYAATARIHYRDDYGYPLYEIHPAPYLVGVDHAPPPLVAIALEEPYLPATETREAERIAMNDLGSLTLTVVPLTRQARDASLSLLLPESLGLLGEPPAFLNGRLPDSSEVYTVAVSNRTAIAGSSILVAATATVIDEEGIAHTTTATTLLPMGNSSAGIPGVMPPLAPTVVAALAGAWILVEIALRLRRRNGGSAASALSLTPGRGTVMDTATLLACLVLVGYMADFPDFLSRTLVVGGDLPAHHYLVSHLREALRHGSVVSWAPGWWCGFPMFRFYFPLPYVVIVMLTGLFGDAVGFKIGLVLGLFALPPAMYAAGRLMRLPRPYPAFLALASIPLLFDNTHTMWGANFHSTFAGMIANSYSMALFPLALASALRDVVDCRARLRSIALLAMLVMSHFFTSILLAAVLGIVFAGLLVASAVGNGGGRRLGALFADGALALMLTAWWVLPVIADRPWSVDFGDPWEIDFLGNLAVFVRWSAVPSILVSAAFLARPLFAKDNQTDGRSLRAFTAALAVLLAASVVLFFFGGAVTPVFVNCRLWPFIVFASLCLSAVAAGLLVRAGRAPVLGWAAFAATVFAWPWDGATNARLWAQYDLRGAEARPHGADFFKMVDDVAGTPGRLAFDMHDGNTQLGSSRIFEAVPALCDKGIVEGGILNSALGALGAYSVQGQVSDQPAGWPSRVTPLSHDLPLGLRRLELLGVRHFIARSTHVRREFDELSDWRLARDYGKWGLYESPRANAPLVTVWDDLPVICTADVQGAIVDWYASTNVPPAILCAAGVPYPEIGGTNCAPRECAAATADAVESWNRVTLRTDAPGKPHHLAVSYYPNWHVRGAARIYPASSGCMVVVPDGDTVEFVWGPTLPDFAGQAVSIAGLVIAAAWGIRSFRTPKTQS